MAFVSRLRFHSLTPHRRAFSTILSPDSATPLTSKQKTRAALSLLKSESNPEKITEICRAAALTPECHLDRIAFSVAIEKLTKSNNFSHIQQVVDGLRNSRDERYVSHAIILLGQANMIDDAIATFKEFQEGLRAASDGMGSVKVLNALLLACIFAKDYSQVKRVFVDFPDAYNIRPNLDTYNTVIKAFSESGSSSSVYSILAEMDRNAVKPDAASFGFCIAGFYKEEKYEDVGKVLNMMKEKYGMSPGLSVYNIRIQSLCKLKKSSEARALFDGLVARGMKPNAVTYSHLIYGFCKEGDLEEAKRLFKTMKGQGLQPDSQCYFTLVYFLCQGGEFETALAFAKESMGKGWVPNFSTMKSLVEGLAKLGKVEEAKKLVGKMKEKFTKNAHLWEELEASLLQ